MNNKNGKKRPNKLRYIPIWIPEFVFISIQRHAKKSRVGPHIMLVKAWTEFLQAQKLEQPKTNHTNEQKQNRRIF